MRLGLTQSELLASVLLPAALLTVPLVGTAFLFWQEDVERREAPLRREIAQNLADKWGRCDLTARWDMAVPCPAR
jgi:hypothetical protein